MKYRLTGEEMELLAMHRAKLDAKLEIVSEKKAELEEEAAELDGILNVIDKIIDSTDEEWKSPYIGTEEDHEGSWIEPGQLACSQESAGLPHDCEQDVLEEGWRQAEAEDDLQRAVDQEGRL